MILPNSSWTFASNYNGADQFNAFKSGLLDLLNPATVDTRSWEGYWNATGYFDRVGASASTWLQPTYARLIGYWQWNFFGKPWIADYEAQNDNRAPFIDPSPRVRWAYARDNVTEAVWNASLAQKATWKELVDTQVLVSDEQTCSSAIYVEPITLGNTNYRVSRDGLLALCDYFPCRWRSLTRSGYLQDRHLCPLWVRVPSSVLGCTSACRPDWPGRV